MSESKVLKVGNKAPAFTLLDQNGEKVSLKDLAGKVVILYFYPKAMTPGCTVQANGLTEVKKKLDSKNAVAIGISNDPFERLKKFEDKEELDLILLSDEDNKVCEKYGVWQLKKNFGKEYMGIVRTTFIIDTSGKIAHIDDKVKTKSHHEDVLTLIDELKDSL